MDERIVERVVRLAILKEAYEKRSEEIKSKKNHYLRWCLSMPPRATLGPGGKGKEVGRPPLVKN